jgi:hypothetical protein
MGQLTRRRIDARSVHSSHMRELDFESAGVPNCLSASDDDGCAHRVTGPYGHRADNEEKPSDFRVYGRPASLSSQTGGIGRLSAHGNSRRSEREDWRKTDESLFSSLMYNDCNLSVLVGIVSSLNGNVV